MSSNIKYKRPPLLIGAALILWGFSVDVLPLGIIMGIILELPLIVSIRYQASDETFDRITSFTTIISMGFIMLILISDIFNDQFIIVFLKWLPITMMPIIAGQYYSDQGGATTAEGGATTPIYGFSIESLFYTFRKRSFLNRQTIVFENKYVDLTYVYFAIAIIGSCAANHRSTWFYINIAILIMYALYFKRSKRFSIIYWSAIILFAVGIGYMGQMGLSRLQGHLEELGISMLSGYSGDYTDPQFSQTRIGKMGNNGKIKQSSKIIMKIIKTSPKASMSQFHLLEAVYNRYLNGQWFVSKSKWTKLNVVKGKVSKDSFSVTDNTFENDDSLVVYSNIDKKAVVLPHPIGSYRFEDITVKDAYVNNLGTIKVNKDKGFLKYRVKYLNHDINDDYSISESDISLSNADKEAVNGFIEKYGLNANISKMEIINRITEIFESDYRYSLKFEATEFMPIENFLNRKKSGHCEYFATATVLILKALGIPARYVTGFSVREYDAHKKQFIVRNRHAHAWAIANINNQWIEVDTTPSVWADDEAMEASVFEPIMDYFQGILFYYQIWKAEGGIERNFNVVYGLLGIVIIYLLIRSESFSLLRLKMSKRSGKDDNNNATNMSKAPISPITPISPFESLAIKLGEIFFTRDDSESLMEWAKRLESNSEFSDTTLNFLKEIIISHYKYRFYSDNEEVYIELNRLVKQFKNENMPNTKLRSIV